MSVPVAARGDVWSVNFDPITGREQGGTRPALVLSVDKYNQGPAELLVVLPLSSKDQRQPLHVAVSPPEGGLSLLSFIKTDNIRSVSKERLRHFQGVVPAQTMAEVEKRLRILLRL